jgi:hypothetical protein
MPRSSHPWLEHPSDIWWTEQITKSIMQSTPASSHIIPFRSKYSSTLFSNSLNLCSQTASICVLPLTWQTKTAGKIIVQFCTFYSTFLDGRREDKDSELHGSKHSPNLVMLVSWIVYRIQWACCIILPS